MSAPVLRANTDLVARAWLGTRPGLALDMVGSQLPRDSAAWLQRGFVQIETVGGAPNIDVPMRLPIVSVSCWATASASGKPPWNQANYLAELVAAACQDSANIHARVSLPEGYPPADVHSAWLESEPRRLYGDQASYARFQFDMVLAWTEAPR